MVHTPFRFERFIKRTITFPGYDIVIILLHIHIILQQERTTDRVRIIIQNNPAVRVHTVRANLATAFNIFLLARRKNK